MSVRKITNALLTNDHRKPYNDLDIFENIKYKTTPFIYNKCKFATIIIMFRRAFIRRKFYFLSKYIYEHTRI